MLSSLLLNLNLYWSLSRANSSGFGPTTQGTDSLTFNLKGIDVATYNQLVAGSDVVAAAANLDLDLTTLTNLVYETVVFTKAEGIMIRPFGGSIVLEPGPTNGLTWFLSGTTPTVTIPDGGCFMYCEGLTGGHTVDSTHKVLRLNNPTGGNVTVDYAIWGTS